MFKLLVYPVLLVLLKGVFGVHEASDLMYFATGVVGAENFTLHKVHQAGQVIISLNTIEGDSDIYVSQNTFVNGDLTDYDYCSATCGHDFLEIPSSFKKPFTIGVYGHPSHQESRYFLEVYNIPENTEDDPLIVERLFGTGNQKEKKIVASSPKDKKVNKLLVTTTKTGIWALLEIIQLIFL